MALLTVPTPYLTVLIIYESFGYPIQKNDYFLHNEKKYIPGKEIRVDRHTYNKTAYLISLVNKLDKRERLSLVNDDWRKRMTEYRGDPEWWINYNGQYMENDTSKPFDTRHDLFQVLLDTNHHGITGTTGATMPSTTTTRKKKWRRNLVRSPRISFISNPSVIEEFRRMRMKKKDNSRVTKTMDSDEDKRRSADIVPLFRVERPSNEAVDDEFSLTKDTFDEGAFKGIFDNQDAEWKKTFSWESKEKNKRSDEGEKNVFSFARPTDTIKAEERSKDLNDWENTVKSDDKKAWENTAWGEIKKTEWVEKKEDSGIDQPTKNAWDEGNNEDRTKKSYDDNRPNNDWDDDKLNKRPKKERDVERPMKDWDEKKPNWNQDEKRWNKDTNEKHDENKPSQDVYDKDEKPDIELNKEKKLWDVNDRDEKRWDEKTIEWNKKNNWDQKKSQIERSRDRKDRDDDTRNIRDWDQPKKKWNYNNSDKKKNDWDSSKEWGNNKKKEEFHVENPDEFNKQKKSFQSYEKPKKKIVERDDWDRPLKNFADDPSLEKDGPRRIRHKKDEEEKNNANDDVIKKKNDYDDYRPKKKNNDWNSKNDWDKKNNDWDKKKDFDDYETKKKKDDRNDDKKSNEFDTKNKKNDDYGSKKKKIDWNLDKNNDDWDTKKPKRNDWDDYDKPKKNIRDEWEPVPTKKKYVYDYDRPKHAKNNRGRDSMAYVRTPIPYRGKKGIYEDVEFK